MESQSSKLNNRTEYFDARILSVLIDARKLGDGGIGVYIDNLVSGLIETPAIEITLISTPERQERFKQRDSVNWIYDQSSPYSIDELFLFPRRIDFSGFDIFHTPHYVLPYRIPIQSVITIHDLIHISHPEKFYYPFIARRIMKSSAHRASAVITVSRDTTQSLLSLTGVSPDKVKHVPNSIPNTLYEAELPRTPISKRCCDLSPYFLTVLSSVKPHKGLLDLISSYRSFRATHFEGKEEGSQRTPRLVLAGIGTEHILQSDELLRLIGDVEGIHVLGPVSNEDLAWLYRKAFALVIPSLAEGFCLPALEAQANGTPVICRPVPAILELITENDFVAADFSVSSLTSAMSKALKYNHGQAKKPIIAHRERYSNSLVAEQTLKIYREVLSQ